ncbi:MAG: aminotransferase class IV [Opitutales bacterium]|nr:aminotransferase class IV [Opitutales bacterium]
MDGEICRLPEVRISPWDQGFLFGTSLFTTFPIDGEGRIPFWLDHQKRLISAATAWNFPIPKTFLLFREDRERRKTLIELLRKNDLSEGAVGRYRLSPGEVGPGLPGKANFPNPREILDVRPLPRTKSAVSLVVLSHRRNSSEEIHRSKNGSYLNTWLAHRELANQANENPLEGLMLDHQGNLAEGTVSNLFWTRSEKLETPSLSTGCLPGLTRAWVRNFCQTNKIPYAEGQWPLEHLLQKDLDSLFVTNCVQGLVPVQQILDNQGSILRSFPNQQPNRLFQKLSANYQKSHQLTAS